MSTPFYIPDWSNYPAVIIASGPSAPDGWHIAKSCMPQDIKIVTVNNSWGLARGAIVYATDRQWWINNTDFLRGRWGSSTLVAPAGKGIENLGLNVRTVSVPPADHPDRHKIIFSPKGVIGSGGNSGFQALNIAAQTGTKDILLVGFDMQRQRGRAHWHADHSSRNPDDVHLLVWRATLDAQAERFKQQGIRVRVVETAEYPTALTAYEIYKPCEV